LKTALINHEDLILDLGDNVLLYPVWNEEKQMYRDEMGWTTMKLLIEIATGKVKGTSLRILEK
jgi:hypothetical protein